MDVFSVLQENRALVLNVYRSVNSGGLRRYLIQAVRPLIANVADEVAAQFTITRENKRFIVDIYTFGLVGIALDWMEDNMSTSYEKYLDPFFLLVDGSMEYVLKKFSD